MQDTILPCLVHCFLHFPWHSGISEKTIKKVVECALRVEAGETVSEDEYIPFMYKLGYRINIFVDTGCICLDLDMVLLLVP